MHTFFIIKNSVWIMGYASGIKLFLFVGFVIFQGIHGSLTVRKKRSLTQEDVMCIAKKQLEDHGVIMPDGKINTDLARVMDRSFSNTKSIKCLERLAPITSCYEIFKMNLCDHRIRSDHPRWITPHETIAPERYDPLPMPAMPLFNVMNHPGRVFSGRNTIPQSTDDVANLDDGDADILENNENESSNRDNEIVALRHHLMKNRRMSSPITELLLLQKIMKSIGPIVYPSSIGPIVHPVYRNRTR